MSHLSPVRATAFKSAFAHGSDTTQPVAAMWRTLSSHTFASSTPAPDSPSGSPSPPQESRRRFGSSTTAGRSSSTV